MENSFNLRHLECNCNWVVILHSGNETFVKMELANRGQNPKSWLFYLCYIKMNCYANFECHSLRYCVGFFLIFLLPQGVIIFNSVWHHGLILRYCFCFLTQSASLPSADSHPSVHPCIHPSIHRSVWLHADLEMESVIQDSSWVADPLNHYSLSSGRKTQTRRPFGVTHY